MQVGLAQAVELTGKHASTITRAVQNGKLSATVGQDGQRQYDVAELERWAGQLKTPGSNGDASTEDVQRNDVHMAELAAKDAEIEGYRERVRLLQEVVEETRKERDRWQEQAGKITHLLTDKRDEATRERERREVAERQAAERAAADHADDATKMAAGGQGRRPGFLGRLFGAGA